MVASPHRRLTWMLVGCLLVGCGSGRGSTVGGTPVKVTTPPAIDAERAAVQRALSDVSSLTADDFRARYSVGHVASLGYDPKTAAGLDRINASTVALSSAEMDALGKNGFVLSGAHYFPTFAYGYVMLYADHLPLYVSADSILDAVHRSYDSILEQIEQTMLIPDLQQFLQGARRQLANAAALDGTTRKDVDLYLAVALGLLTGTPGTGVAGAASNDIASWVNGATGASGVRHSTLFGAARDIDFSQFTPRGHYTDTPELGQYFRAMMWLGRIDFRLIETQIDGSQVFQRRQFDAMLALTSLLDASGVALHHAIDSTIEAFVGESDNMKVEDVDKLRSDLGAPPGASSVNLADQRIAQAILDGGYGAQRIASDLMRNGLSTLGTLPLNRSFLVFGQRYTVDSHVFSNVVYDRVQGGRVRRMMPSPLDVAFAALRNDQAGALLDGELRQYKYAPDLASMRVLVDAHGDGFWGENLYNLWLSSLRALSPTSTTADPASAGMPLVTGTEPWGRRILNTQLGSWAELRHDTILYAKQSYTGEPSCEFPDAYVDPYPDFYTALARFADLGTSRILPIVHGTPLDAPVAQYFSNLGTVTKTLAGMASSERSGAPFSADQMAFINQTVRFVPGCAGPSGATGWYSGLIFVDPVKFDPTIADVHTEPADESGAPVGRILHVGTGNVRLLVVTANTCTGPRAYAGLAFSYYEQITANYDRLTDERWAAELASSPPPDVPWLADLAAPIAGRATQYPLPPYCPMISPFTAPSQVQVGQGVVLSAASPTPNVAFQWEVSPPSGGTFSPDSSSPDVTFQCSGPGTVTVTLRSVLPDGGACLDTEPISRLPLKIVCTGPSDGGLDASLATGQDN
jgi:hypothetical protein